MTDGPTGKRYFFVSFNQTDRAWATWIAWTLEENGYSVTNPLTLYPTYHAA